MPTTIKKKPVVRRKKTTEKKTGRKYKQARTVNDKKKINEKIEALIARGESTEKFNPDDLTPQERFFCELFASDREFFGNGTQSYIEAYDVNLSIPGAYDSARAKASQLLTRFNILAYINDLMELSELNDAFVDRQHAMLIVQNADFKTKMAAIKHYDVKKGRITRKFKIDKHTHVTVSDEEKEMLDDIFGAG